MGMVPSLAVTRQIYIVYKGRYIATETIISLGHSERDMERLDHFLCPFPTLCVTIRFVFWSTSGSSETSSSCFAFFICFFFFLWAANSASRSRILRKWKLIKSHIIHAWSIQTANKLLILQSYFKRGERTRIRITSVTCKAKVHCGSFQVSIRFSEEEASSYSILNNF